ncbi:MAG: restriction endonuclease subunit S [Gammaproteobacteria bacterium]|nr:restriction endonuclease subunit S [Gammaproteobacteria bacterium]
MSQLIPLRQLISFASRGISPRYVANNGIIVLNQKCIRENKVSLEPSRLTDKTKKFSEEKKLKKFDVLINSTGVGTLGRVAQLIFDLDATVDSHVSIFRPAEDHNGKKIDPKYIGYSVRSHEKEIEALGKGATGQTELSKNSVLDGILIHFPTFSTQTRIASILSAYDDLIENNEKRIIILEEMAERLYREWFVKFKFPGHEKVRLIDSGTEYGMIPEGWEVKRLDSNIELAYGKALKAENRVPGGILVCGSGGVVGTHDKKLATGPGIIVGRKGNAGAVFWVHGDFWPIDTAYFVKTKLSLVFTYYLLKTQSFVLGDAAVPGLNREQAYRNLTLIPPGSLISTYTIKTQPLRELIGKIQVINNNLSKIRDLLIPQLVTGKREVK